jgi:hypothetical protein
MRTHSHSLSRFRTKLRQKIVSVPSPLYSRAGPGHVARDFSSVVLCTCPPLYANNLLMHSLLSLIATVCVQRHVETSQVQTQ